MKSTAETISQSNGYSLLELIITMTVLAVLVLGTIPLVQNSIKRQKEQELRESLRMMRSAIDEFKRDVVGACGNQTAQRDFQTADPRSRVVISDCKIFEVDNIDRYPPTLDILVEGVQVKSRFPNIKATGDTLAFGKDDAATGSSEATKDKKKIYLRELPKDPMTGEKDWKFRSSFQEKDASWDETNVFDVRSSSDEEALNGEKYSEW
jgi:general secretion pathway protein G